MIRLSPRFVASVIPAVFVIGLSARAAAASTMPLSHHDAVDGYRVGLPVDWERISDADLAVQSRAARKAGAPNTIQFDKAFQPGRSRRSFEYPHVIVQVLPYASIGLNLQVDENEFPEIVRRMTGMNLRLSRAQSLKLDARLDAPVLERSQRRYWMTGEMTVPRQGRVRSLVAGYFGRDAIVQVCFYAKAVDWDRHATTGRRICESLKFDAAKGYPVAEVPAKAAPVNDAAANPVPENATPAYVAAASPAGAAPTPRADSDQSFGAMKVVIGLVGGVVAGLVGHAMRPRRTKPADEIDPATYLPRPW